MVSVATPPSIPADRNAEENMMDGEFCVVRGPFFPFVSLFSFDILSRICVMRPAKNAACTSARSFLSIFR